MAQYAFKVTSKGMGGYPKGLSVTIVRSFSTTPNSNEIADAFLKQHGIKGTSVVPGFFVIEKL